MSIGIIILAAGASSRMKESKLLLPVFNTSLLENIVEQAFHSSAAQIILVSGAHAIPVESLSKFSGKVKIIHNESWPSGMGSSIKLGLLSLIEPDKSLNAVLYLVADQPYVHSLHLDTLIKTFHETGKICASNYANSPGVPVLFPGKYFNQILTLSNEHGAKKIIMDNLDDVALIEFPQGAIDIDTPDDYQRFLNNQEKNNYSKIKKPS
jgi:molybdenum cofactor cytidylyltransferase